MSGLSGQSLAVFVEAIGSTEPAPGAGAAAAVALAMAAACLAKAFAISARHVDDPAALAAAADEARELSRLALAGAGRDAEDFATLLHAKGRTAQPAEALRRDGEAMLALTRRVRDLAKAHSSQVAPAMAGDLAAALALAAASGRIQRNDMAELG